MPINRRAFALASLAVTTSARASEVDEPVVLPLAMTDPDEIYAALRDTAFASALLPDGYGKQEIVVWDDSSDSDLDGAIGGLLFGPAGAADEAFFGIVIVHEDVDTARDRVTEVGGGEPSETFTYLGLEGRMIVNLNDEYGYAIVAVPLGPLIVSGAADVATYPEDYVTRSVTHLVAVIDHIQRVTRITP